MLGGVSNCAILAAFGGVFNCAILAAFGALDGVLGLPPGCCGDTESAILAEVANGLEGTDGLVSTTIALLAAVATEPEGTGAGVSPTINTGVLGVSVAVLVTVTGRFVVRKSRSMHF